MSDFAEALRSLWCWQVLVICLPGLAVIAWVLYSEHATRKGYRELEARLDKGIDVHVHVVAGDGRELQRKLLRVRREQGGRGLGLS